LVDDLLCALALRRSVTYSATNARARTASDVWSWAAAFVTAPASAALLLNAAAIARSGGAPEGHAAREDGHERRVALQAGASCSAHDLAAGKL